MLVDANGLDENTRHKYACLVQEMFQCEVTAVLIGQYFASMVEGGASLNDMVQLEMEAIRHASWLATEANDEIWDELIPGYPGDYRWSLVMRPQVPPPDLPILEVVSDNSDNIVLEYKVKIYQGEDLYYADKIEFFKDEHGFQWAKFFPRNGYDHGKEHMVRMDQVSRIVRYD